MARLRRNLIAALLIFTGLLAACRSDTAMLPSPPTVEALKQTAVAMVSPVAGDVLSAPTPPAITSRHTALLPTHPAGTPGPETVAATDRYAQIARRMLALVNADRTSHGLQQVAWDDFAAQVGTAHAQDMATHGYFSHVDQQGQGPDLRYALAGGAEAVFENLYSLSVKYSDGSGGSIDDWDKALADAEKQLMGSPGHRAQILSPDHTHVGIGLAWNAQTGELRLAQEFLNRFARLQPLPGHVDPGTTLRLRGELLPGVTQPLVNLAWEPLPTPPPTADLVRGQSYQSPARLLEAISVQSSGNTFQGEVTLPSQGEPGYYHIRLWVKRDGRDVLVCDPVVRV